MDGTPWAYIHEKRRSNELASEAQGMEERIVKYKAIIKKLLNPKEVRLTKTEIAFLNEEKIIS